MIRETEMRARVQPLTLADENEEGGERLAERFTVYALNPLDIGGRMLTDSGLQGANLAAKADIVVWRGQVYNVIESERWPSYTKAIMGRST